MELIFSDIEIINIEGVFESNIISTVPKIVKIPTHPNLIKVGLPLKLL